MCQGPAQVGPWSTGRARLGTAVPGFESSPRYLLVVRIGVIYEASLELHFPLCKTALIRI